MKQISPHFALLPGVLIMHVYQVHHDTKVIKAVSRKDDAFFRSIFRGSRIFLEWLRPGGGQYPVKNRSSSGSVSGNLEHQSDADVLFFEISSQKMQELLAHRQICAADVRCLDTESKQCLKKLCLKTCLYNASWHQTDLPA